MNMTPFSNPSFSIKAVLAIFAATFLTTGHPLRANGDDDVPKYRSVDHIEGVGKLKFGAKLKDFPPALLQPVAPTASGVLLRVTPYGDNYLVKDLTGLTWGGLPVAGMVVTFHDGSLIDIQLTLSAKKGDFYVIDRAFKDKYGPSEPRSFPLETWTGDKLQVTLAMIGVGKLDSNSLDAPAQAKVEMFDASQWSKVEAVQKAKLQEILDQRYLAARQKVKADL